MGLFSSNVELDDSHNQLSGLIAEDCSFEGIIIFEGIFRIDGQMTGKIICKPNKKGTLVISSKARVEVDLLSVDSLMISGVFFANGPVIALDTANFHGNSRVEVAKNHALYSSNLIVKDKALFQGKSVMIRHETDDTKLEIKKFVFNNKLKAVSLPFKQNTLSLNNTDNEL